VVRGRSCRRCAARRRLDAADAGFARRLRGPDRGVDDGTGARRLQRARERRRARTPGHAARHGACARRPLGANAQRHAAVRARRAGTPRDLRAVPAAPSRPGLGPRAVPFGGARSAARGRRARRRGRGRQHPHSDRRTAARCFDRPRVAAAVHRTRDRVPGPRRRGARGRVCAHRGHGAGARNAVAAIGPRQRALERGGPRGRRARHRSPAVRRVPLRVWRAGGRREAHGHRRRRAGVGRGRCNGPVPRRGRARRRRPAVPAARRLRRALGCRPPRRLRGRPPEARRQHDHAAAGADAVHGRRADRRAQAA